jgi:hypothetical protein
VDLLARRCEQLMRAAEKEVEQLERIAREFAGLPTDATDGEDLPPIDLPNFHVLQKQRRDAKREKVEKERTILKSKVQELEDQIASVQNRLKALNSMSGDDDETTLEKNKPRRAPSPECATTEIVDDVTEPEKGAPGPNGEYVEFPAFDCSEPPSEPKKAFTHFCNGTRKDVKASMDPSFRKDKVRFDDLLLLFAVVELCTYNFQKFYCVVNNAVEQDK